MNREPALLLIAIALSLTAGAQNPTPATPSGAPATQVEKQRNAASATQDNSAISGDQVTKPAGAKSSTVVGCLGSPDSDGHLVLRSMQYRSGVEVLGPNNLSAAAGQKVKLNGQWVPAAESQNAATTSQDATSQQQNRRFQVTSFEVLAQKCPPPAETTPISKKKQKQQKAAEDSQNNPQ
jgi:hypothetical protein